MFAGYLKLAADCDACGLDYSFADPADGPAVFVMFIAGFAVVIPALLLEVAVRPPMLVHWLIWPALAVGLCAALLRPFKGVMFALQYRYGAEEARFEDQN